MTDFFALPGDYANVPIPDRFRTPPTPMPSDDSMPGRVESTEAEWRKRASIAREAESELREARRAIGRVLHNNYFGDCIEGRNVYSKLKSILDSWSSQLDDQATAAAELARQCESAGRRLSDADIANARDIRG